MPPVAILAQAGSVFIIFAFPLCFNSFAFWVSHVLGSAASEFTRLSVALGSPSDRRGQPLRDEACVVFVTVEGQLQLHFIKFVLARGGRCR